MGSFVAIFCLQIVLVSLKRFKSVPALPFPHVSSFSFQPLEGIAASYMFDGPIGHRMLMVLREGLDTEGICFFG